MNDEKIADATTFFTQIFDLLNIHQHPERIKQIHLELGYSGRRLPFFTDKELRNAIKKYFKQYPQDYVRIKGD